MGQLHRLARQRRETPAVIDHDGVTTFGALFARAAEQARAREAGSAATAWALPAANTAVFLAQVCAALMAGHTPIAVPPYTSKEALQAVTRGLDLTLDSGCRPWKAVFSIDAGRQRLLVTHGESPTVPRKARALGMLPGGCALIASPLHLNGPLEFALRQLLLGGTVVLLPRFNPSRWRQAAREHRPDWAFLVPTQLQQVWDSGTAQQLTDDCASLRHLVHSSAPCPPDLSERLAQSLGPERVAEYYGTTAYDGTLTRYHRAAHGGAPIPGADLRIVDDAGWPVPPGTDGVIQGRSSAGLVTHFADQPCPRARHWQSSGDRGRLTAAGNLVLTDVEVPGRAIVAGVKVALATTRETLAAHPDVHHATVAVRADRRFGALLTASVTARTPALTAADLRRWCASRLTAPQRPYHYDVTALQLPDSCDPLREGHACL
ncbi:AMP-binding protein [Streptacidiphilus sp. EB103A]|uniref:AMP-binding protein n=1 Tax=Streptacidiphilus sp. EB103A TaxID=3156275 RepID=UPI00351977B8